MAKSFHIALQPYVMLLASLVFFLIVGALPGMQGRTILGVMFLLVMLAGVNAASDGRRHRLIAVVLAVPWLFVGVALPLIGTAAPKFLADLCFAPFIVFVTSLVLRNVISGTTHVNLNTVCGALAVYLLMALIWALAFENIHGWVPGSFAMPETIGVPDTQRFIYFSLTTITTLGYGDFHPVSPLAQTLAVLEAMTGVFYIAVLVARLVSVYRGPSAGDPEDSTSSARARLGNRM